MAIDRTQLTRLGWLEEYIAAVPPQDRAGLLPARVTEEQKIAYMVVCERGELLVSAAGTLRHHTSDRADMPAVGDWVLIRLGTAADEGISGQIVRVLPRRTTLARTLATGESQILATNVDLAFLLTSLNTNFNLRRMERYLSLVQGTGVTPVLLLSKADLIDNVDEVLADVRAIAPHVPVHAISSLTHFGFDIFPAYLTPGKTVVLLGSSGVGKSTLVNHLADADIQDMMEAREFDDKGRHCTTFRHLIPLPAPYHAAAIDTPGMRALGLGDAEEGLLEIFSDVEALALRCRFTSCRHENEPGCAIREAIAAGTLAEDRLISYQKLQREITAVAAKQAEVDLRKERKRLKKNDQQFNQRHNQKWKPGRQ